MWIADLQIGIKLKQQKVHPNLESANNAGGVAANQPQVILPQLAECGGETWGTGMPCQDRTLEG